MFKKSKAYSGTATACAYTSTTASVDWDFLRRTMVEFELRRQKELRDWSRIIEQTTCNKCGRKPTLAGGGTLVVCPHLYEAIKKNSELHSKACVSDFLLLPGSLLLGIPIMVFDDGPARW